MRTLVALLVFLLPSTATLAQTFPGLNESVIDVGGRRMQVWTGGPAASAEGPPLVVFENGWNAGAGSWSRVATEVAKFAPVLLYNRGGHGKSEWDGELPTPEHVARRLDALLRVLDLAPRRLLVGHSWGGPLIRAHAALYPESVAGLVYVDPSSRCILERAFETAGAGAHAAEFLNRQQRQDVVGVHPRDVPAPEPAKRIALPDVPVVLLIGLNVAPGAGPQTKWLQQRGIDSTAIATAARQHKVPCLSPLAMEVPRGSVVATPFSGHVIQQDEPDLIVWALRRILSAPSRKPAGGPATPMLAAQSTEQNSSRVALTNVTLIDGTGAMPRAGMSVLIQDGRIRDVFRTGEQTIPAGVTIHDLTGRYVIPGLINTHVHLLPIFSTSRESGLSALERMLYAGVTTVREMVGDTRVTAEAARTVLLGARPLPNIHYAALMAGPAFFTDRRAAPTSIGYEPGEAPWAQAITRDTDIARAVARAAGTGATGIKIYADLEPQLVGRIAAEARRQGLQTWAHSTIFPSRPLDAVRAGVDGLSHVCGLVWQGLASVPNRYHGERKFDPNLVEVTAPAFVDLFAEMRRRGTSFDPTANHFNRTRRPEASGCTLDLRVRLLKGLHQAGIRISTGTDYVMNEGEPDPTLFSEMAHLVETGVLTPLEAITAATVNGARAIGIEQTHGSIAPGKVADLVVLAADPTREIAAIRTIVSIIKGGKIYPRKEYDDRVRPRTPVGPGA